MLKLESSKPIIPYLKSNLAVQIWPVSHFEYFENS